MPRKKIEVRSATTSAGAGLAGRLAEELKSGRACGQPVIYEQEYATKKSRVTVIWDEWADASLEERSSIILRAYELAEGKECAREDRARQRADRAGSDGSGDAPLPNYRGPESVRPAQARGCQCGYAGTGHFRVE